MYKPIPEWKKRLINFLFPKLNNIEAVEGIDLNNVGFKTTCEVDESDRPKHIKFPGESAAKSWFENSNDGFGYFNQDLYNKIKDYQKCA